MKKRIICCLVWVVTLATIIFIFSNSCKSQSVSQAQSGRFLSLVKPLLAFFVGEEHVTIHLVRKLAHFSEFGLLGAEGGLLLWLYAKKDKKSMAHTTAALFATAFLDETIQIFTGRGPMIQDVWLDFAGGVCGLLLMAPLRVICHLIRQRRKA